MYICVCVYLCVSNDKNDRSDVIEETGLYIIDMNDLLLVDIKFVGGLKEFLDKLNS